ncbi:MAG: histone deacetylase [Pseudomonadota bacterium]
MINIVYDPRYNFELGLLGRLHPFDGTKFRRIYDDVCALEGVNIVSPGEPAATEVIDQFLSSIMQKKVRDRVFVFRALEVPQLPLVSIEYLDKKVLTPMRWGVAGTLLAANRALSDPIVEGQAPVFWNLSGGYHHAMPQSMEGFCIYNDIGICHQQLVKANKLSANDRVLIIDTDAHHGNGNAHTFMETPNVTILDVFNQNIYPTSDYTRERVDLPVPLRPGTDGDVYLGQYEAALNKVGDDARIAFVVAGTDVLASDKLGGLNLEIADVAAREALTLRALKKHCIPTVILGGGGYSKDSAKSVIAAVKKCATPDTRTI